MTMTKLKEVTLIINNAKCFVNKHTTQGNITLIYVAIEDDKHISIVIAFFRNILEFSINYRSNDVKNLHLDIY